MVFKSSDKNNNIKNRHCQNNCINENRKNNDDKKNKHGTTSIVPWIK